MSEQNKTDTIGYIDGFIKVDEFVNQLGNFIENLLPTPLQTEVFCTLQFEALHNWTTCHIEEVEYLKYPHRHVFHIKAHKIVTHVDRDVEIIVLKHTIHEYLLDKYPTHNFGSQSCEMIATELLNEFNLSKCEVSEDLENGAIVTKLT